MRAVSHNKRKKLFEKALYSLASRSRGESIEIDAIHFDYNENPDLDNLDQYIPTKKTFEVEITISCFMSLAALSALVNIQLNEVKN